MNEKSISSTVVDAPRRGRPRQPEPSTAVCAWVPATYHDRLIRLARQRDVSVSSLVKAFIVRGITAKP